VPLLDATQTANTAKQVLDREGFLQLLVAQLKYQDPANPTDANQLMNTTAQLTLVDKINELVTLQQGQSTMQRAALAGSLVGKTATYTTTDASGAATTATGVIGAVKLSGTDLVLRIGSRDVAIADVVELAPTPSTP
jgi:flagellar basal-body rod modification protein FlgD